MTKNKIKGYCIVSAFSIILYLLLTRINNVGAGIYELINLLMPFLIGLIIAFVLNNFVDYLQNVLDSNINHRFKNKRTTRLISIIIVYLIVFVVISALVYFLFPQLAGSIARLGKNIQVYLNNLNLLISSISEKTFIPQFVLDEAEILLESAASKIIAYITGSVPQVLSIAVEFGGSIVNIVIGLIVSIHLIFDKEKLISQVKRLNKAFLPGSVSKAFEEIGTTVNSSFKNYVSGQLLDALIVGIASIIGLSLLNFPYAVLIGTIMGLTNIIPFYGPFIGSIPSFLIILLEDPIKAIYYIIFVIVLQQIDGNIIAPKIIGGSVGLPALWVLFSVTVGGALFGIPGMILGTPIFAVFYELLGKSTRKREMSMK